MSVVLSVYSQSAYKEFVLPAIHNAETVLVIDRRVFHLKDSIELRLEEMDGANYAQTECQFRYCGTAIPFLTVRSTAR